MSKWFTNNLKIKAHIKRVDPSCVIKTLIANNALVKKYENSFLKHEIDYWPIFNTKVVIFMVLLKSTNLKISKAIEEPNSECISCFQPKDLKLRSIVAVYKCPSKRHSNFVDILLKHLLFKIKSYVKDDFDFLEKCKRNITENSKLVSFDVTRLYTSIPYELGLKATEY